MDAAQAPKRRLSAILHADIAGFSRLMQQDEVAAHAALEGHRAGVDPLIARHGGRIVGTAGDSVLAEFGSVVDALVCAVEMQAEVARRNAELPADTRMQFRIGINLGDVIVDGNDIFGDGVNIAARLQALAKPGGICISGAVYEQVRHKLAYRFVSMGERQVKNIAQPIAAYAVEPEAAPAALPGRRKRIILPLAAAAGVITVAVVSGWFAWQWTRPAPAPVTTAAAPASAPLPEVAPEPLVAVLPFANLSGDAAQEYFSDGVTEDVINALGRFPGIRVAARSAVFRLKGQALSPMQVGDLLKARYVVEGSIRKSGDRVRVGAQLTDAAAGLHLWSDRYDGEMTEVFALQDEITRRIAGAIAVKLGRLEQERATAKPTGNLVAYDYVLRGRALLAQGTRASNWEARGLFEQALVLDQGYALAHALLAWTQYQAVVSGWTEFAEEDLDAAMMQARKALARDPSTALAHRVLAFGHLYRREYDRAMQESARALELNPSDAESYVVRGAVLMWSGHAEEGTGWAEIAVRLDPTSAIGLANLGFNYYLLRRYEDARRALEDTLVRGPIGVHRVFSHVLLAASHAQLGRADEASREQQAVRRLAPFFDGRTFIEQFQAVADRQHVADGLRKAGLL